MRRSILVLAAVLTVAASISEPAWARDGRVFSLRGRATLNGKVFTRRTPVSSGDEIQTRGGSSVKIVMKDRSVIHIGPNTTLKISEFSYEPNQSSGWKSTFGLVKGGFRYVSGLIAKVRRQQVAVHAGVATIGIRGSYQEFTINGTVGVQSNIGSATVTLPDGSSFTIPTGNTGDVNTDTGDTSLDAITDADPAMQAAQGIAGAPNDPGAIGQALGGLSAAEQALAIGVLANNSDAPEIGLPSGDLAPALQNAAISTPTNAALLVFMASALQPGLADQIIQTVANALPAQAAQIRAAGEAGKDVNQDAPGGGGGGGGTGDTAAGLPPNPGKEPEDPTLNCTIIERVIVELVEEVQGTKVSIEEVERIVQEEICQ